MKIKIDRSWKFRRTDIEDDWRQLDLPHDWAIEADFEESGYQDWIDPERRLVFRHDSYLPRGTGEYRKTLDIPQIYQNQKVFLETEGVFGESVLFVDGEKAGGNDSGYTGKVYDITRFAAGKNAVEIAMNVSAERMQGWWYEGAGIYRHIHLIIKPECYIEPWGIGVTTPEIRGDQAKIVCAVDLREGQERIGLSAQRKRIEVALHIVQVQDSLAVHADQLHHAFSLLPVSHLLCLEFTL